MTYRVQAYNTATASENKIHDDAVAGKLGFGGGLVPGVDVYAYMTHPVVERWGQDWLRHGCIQARFLQPVYDGEIVEVAAAAGAAAGSLEVSVRNPAREICATAGASLPEAAADPGAADFPRLPLPGRRPPASPETLRPGTLLGTLDAHFDAADAPQYLADVREPLTLYRERGIAHPGYLLRFANYVLALNVQLGPWIHVGSDVRHYGIVESKGQLSTRARVRDAYEKKGHRFVELDVLMLVDEERPVMSVRHTAIYEPRQLRA